ncbi:UNVERIFIED_CONTAM: hypothetical protein FKN15_035268 [Acipenser sinensis]
MLLRGVRWKTSKPTAQPASAHQTFVRPTSTCPETLLSSSPGQVMLPVLLSKEEPQEKDNEDNGQGLSQGSDGHPTFKGLAERIIVGLKRVSVTALPSLKHESKRYKTVESSKKSPCV